MPGMMPMPSEQSSPIIGAGGVSQSGSWVENQPPQEMGLTEPPEELPEGTATPDSDKDAEAGAQQFVEEPWFAKLPPELRDAIRNNARRRPPRGYEERLQRYFESMD
jgi:hypothetical protein